MADFGLTEDMYNSNYYRQENRGKGDEEKVPIKWMALESIETHVFDESTDVVSPVAIHFSIFIILSVSSVYPRIKKKGGSSTLKRFVPEYVHC